MKYDLPITIPRPDYLRKEFLKISPPYDPYFRKETTQSIEDCLDAIVDVETNAYRHFRNEARQIYSRRMAKMPPKSMRSAGAVIDAFRAIFEEGGVNLDELNKLIANPPRKIRSSKRGFYKELVKTFLPVHVIGSIFEAVMLPSTCFFEPQDISYSLDDVFDPKRCQDRRAKFKLLSYQPHEFQLRQIITAEIYIRPDHVMLNYTTLNQSDKITVKMRIDSKSCNLYGYEFDVKTPRDDKPPIDRYVISISGRTGDSVVRFEKGSKLPNIRFEKGKEMNDDLVYSILCSYPIFLGGNAFLSFMNDVIGNYQRFEPQKP